MGASFEEKSAWITLASLLLVFGFYFWVAARMLLAGVTEAAAYMPLFGLVTVLLVVVLAAAHAVAALSGRADGPDERDRLIAWRAEHNSAWLLGAGTLAAIFALALPPVERAWVANGLLAFLCLSSVLSYALRVLYYRRGM